MSQGKVFQAKGLARGKSLTEEHASVRGTLIQPVWLKESESEGCSRRQGQDSKGIINRLIGRTLQGFKQRDRI